MFHLQHSQIRSNILGLQNWMMKRGLDYFYLSGLDPYISEYVPREESHRYYVTGFTGSMAEVLVPANGHALIYADGRYHQQAELEIDPSVVKLRKSGINLRESLMDDLKQMQNKNLRLGVEADRTAYSWAQEFRRYVQLESFESSELQQTLYYRIFRPKQCEVVGLDDVIPNEGIEVKLKKIIQHPGQAFFISALDQVAWACHARGYHLPHSSPFLAKALILAHKIYLFHPFPFQLTDELAQHPLLEWVCWEKIGLQAALETVKAQENVNIQKLHFDPEGCTLEDFELLSKVFSPRKLESTPGGLIDLLANKTANELEAIRASFDLADQAIFNALKEIRRRVGQGEVLSEYDLKESCERHYLDGGAICQSFNTIASFGENTAIVHYGKAGPERKIKKGEWMLLDSGAYFQYGMATDTTRTMMSNPEDQPSARQKEIYTLVLKSYISAHRAVVKVGSMGAVIDGYARYPLNQRGLNYEHNTGHGVGVMVHEGGVNFRAHSTARLRPGQVVSLEPGLYMPGEGGCRFENIVELIAHPQYPGYLALKSLVYIGVDPQLVQEDLLSSEELAWLEDYEGQCLARARSFGWRPKKKS